MPTVLKSIVSVAGAVRPGAWRPVCPRPHRYYPSYAGTAVRTSKHGPAVTILGLTGGLLAYHAISTPEHDWNKSYSQHVQVVDSWKHPGVYAWGSNKGRVVAPDSSEECIRGPRRLECFDNVLLRDLKLSSNLGLAVDEKGNLYEWGTGYSENIKAPEIVLAGKDIQSVEASADRIFALSRAGKIYSLPKAKRDQQEGPKPDEPGVLPFLKHISPVSYRILQVPLNFLESVSNISAGLDHLLILTTAGRVFSSAASNTYPVDGQLGIPGLSWATRPKNERYDTSHLITVSDVKKFTQIAAGDYHSVLLDSEGRVWTFGSNSHGQLGFDYHPELTMRDIPTELSIQGLYHGTRGAAKCTKIAAGGANTYFMVDVVQERNGKVSADVWASGKGLWGGLGNGKWTHVQGQPIKIKALSGLIEYDENTDSIVPIRASYICPGRTHTAVVMSTRSNTSPTNEADTLNGQDVLWWGNNEFYQLGTGKRSNVNIPSYIPPLLMEGAFVKEPEQLAAEQQQLVPQNRLQVTPKQKATLGDGRKQVVEQRVVTGDGVSGVYTKV
ncbi:regulator of chromosome condensation 1/beta-lactamase-inhibitor protein II [Kalaharituber pfeilii]|nr:regulator of chromosome condensation 1/beta-lactamase-inhibitor protein II [Kalaharituber pfeilii]